MKTLKDGVDWTCSYCGKTQVLQRGRNWVYLFNDDAPGESKFGERIAINCLVVRCGSAECGELTVGAELLGGKSSGQYNTFRADKTIRRWRLLPESAAKPQPDFIPSVLRTDYVEACRIRDLSPKASATLARRCLQGMIRDFCGISKSRLIDEIKELRLSLEAGSAPQGVSAESVDAIDAVREIGNIGAHMERDINLIVDVDPDEAQLLIELIEMLFEEWYVEREQRSSRLERLKKLAAEKQAARKPSPREGGTIAEPPPALK